MNQKNTGEVRQCAFGGVAAGAMLCATVFLGVGAVAHAAPPGSIEIPGTKTSIKFGGWMKLTFLHDTKARSDDFISYNEIPLDGTSNAERTGHTRLHARESRFNMMTLTPYDGGRKIKTFLEFDFFGGGGPDEFAAEQRVSNSYSPRLRQAFGELTFGAHKWLFGQTWTNFMHPALITDRVDFSSPPGSHFIRQAQIRYTYAPQGGAEFSIALENPESELNGDGISGGPPFNPDQENDKVPDVTARWQTRGKWGLLYVSAVLRQHSLEDRSVPTNIIEETATAGGIGFGLRAKVFGKDIVRLQLAGGDGMGRYIKELDGQGATFNAATGDLEATSEVGGIIGYTRSWNPRWRTNLIFGFADVDNEPIASVAGANERLTSIHLNTFYSPFKNVDLGLEYAYGKREIETGLETEGEVGRISFGAKIRL